MNTPYPHHPAFVVLLHDQLPDVQAVRFAEVVLQLSEDQKTIRYVKDRFADRQEAPPFPVTDLGWAFADFLETRAEWASRPDPLPRVTRILSHENERASGSWQPTLTPAGRLRTNLIFAPVAGGEWVKVYKNNIGKNFHKYLDVQPWEVIPKLMEEAGYTARVTHKDIFDPDLETPSPFEFPLAPNLVRPEYRFIKAYSADHAHKLEQRLLEIGIYQNTLHPSAQVAINSIWPKNDGSLVG